MEAEIIAANEGAKDIAWMEKLATDLGECSKDESFIPTLYCDNASGVDWMQENKFHSKAKHIDIRWHYIRKGVTRRVEEKRCSSCIKSVYRSGRVSVMIWGAIGWNWKSPLVFLEKKEGNRSITLEACRDQMLVPIVFLLFDELGPEYIFIEDGSKMHLEYARKARLEHFVRGFNWPPSSPNFNPIEKVWRWMKRELKKLPFVPTSIEELKRELKGLWERVDPLDFRPEIERLTCKLEDVIELRGLATIH